MDQTELQQKIVLYYSKLPPKAQEAFGSMAWMETLKKISAKYQLSGAEMETLGTETTLLLLGIIHEDEYQEILRKDLSLPEISTNRMIREINESVIDPIRPELTTELETATTQVILDIIPPHKFEGVLKASLDLPEEKITALAGEVNEKILKDIRAKMLIRYNLDKPVNLEREEHEVLKRAGIEVLTDPVLDDQELLAGPVYPELARKFTEPTKTETKKTEHTLENLTPTSAPLPPSTKEKPKVDPYPEPIE